MHHPHDEFSLTHSKQANHSSKQTAATSSLLVQGVSLGLGHGLDLACGILTGGNRHPLALTLSAARLQHILELLRAAVSCAGSGLRCVLLQTTAQHRGDRQDISLRALCALLAILLLQLSKLACQAVGGVHPQQHDGQQDDTQVRCGGGQGAETDDHELLDQGTT